METPYGSVTFTVYGTPKPKRPAILTYHDVGLNCKDLHFSSPSFWEEAKEVGRVNPQCKGKGFHGQEETMGHAKKFSSSLTVAWKRVGFDLGTLFPV